MTTLRKPLLYVTTCLMTAASLTLLGSCTGSENNPDQNGSQASNPQQPGAAATPAATQQPGQMGTNNGGYQTPGTSGN